MMSKRLLKHVVMMTLLLSMLCGMTSTAFAATRISSVTIKVEKDGDNYYPALSLTTSNCTITEQSEWEDLNNLGNYERVRKYITIKANEGYEFSSQPTSKLTGNRKSNTMIQVTKLSSTEVRVRITYKILEVSEPDDAYWDRYNIGTARVAKVYGAKKYRFKLYVDGYVEKNVTTKETDYDFSKTLKKDDVYNCDVYFEVCAIFDGDNESEYAQSDEFEDWRKLDKYSDNNNNSSPSYPSYPSKPGTSSGSNSCIWPNGVGLPETPGMWEMINGYWYFKQNGQYLTGWIVYKGQWYYLATKYDTSPSGRAFPKGAAYSGTWVAYNNNWYYFYSAGQDGHLEGEMARNRWLPGTNGGSYYVNDSGAWVK